jgi:hypothetical protein
MGISMINTTFVESTIENIQIIKKELLNDCGFDIDHINENKIKLSCGGKCWGHDNEILEICKDIKLLSQHIDIDSDDFHINYYYKNNKFSCNFGWDNEGGYGNIDDLTTEELNILVEENIFSIVNGEYVNNEKFPFCRKTTSIYCNVCKEHHDSKYKCANQKEEVKPIKIEDKIYNNNLDDEEEEIKPSKKTIRKK